MTASLKYQIYRFRFPSDKNRLETWCTVLGIAVRSLPINAFICSNHFSQRDFKKSKCRVRLSDSAVPAAYSHTR